jgi:5'-nucleotidase
MSASLQKLVILHTNDIHSHFEQMPQIATAIQTFRSKHGAESVLTIDCGDHMDRMRMETEGTNGLANIGVMNATGYDIVTLGNNEGLTLNMADLAVAYAEHAKFIVLGSNLFDALTEKHPLWLQPYCKKRINGIRVGFIAVTAYFIDFYRLLGWDIREPMAVVDYWVKALRGQVDVLIVISHLGINHDQHMAREIQGIDLILGSHTHHLLEEPLRIKDTYVCAAGKFGQYVGEVEISYDLEQQQLFELKGRCVPVKDYQSDAAISRLIANYRVQSAAELNQVVATLHEPLAIDWHAESSLGNLLAAALRKWLNADIGIVNAGQLLQSLRQGDVTREHLLEMCPSPINPCRMLLQGIHIHTALEEALQLNFQEKTIQGYGFRGKMLGILCTDGLQVEYDPKGKDYHKLNNVWVNGELLQLDQLYQVGTIDMFTFGIGYMSLQKGQNIAFSLPEFLRDLMAKALCDPEAIAKSHQRHWFKA